MIARMKVDGLGQIGFPLHVAEIEGKTKLIVSPIAAIGTDVLGAGMGMALGVFAKPIGWKLLGYAGAAWMLTAATVEIVKLATGPQRKFKEQFNV